MSRILTPPRDIWTPQPTWAQPRPKRCPKCGKPRKHRRRRTQRWLEQLLKLPTAMAGINSRGCCCGTLVYPAYSCLDASSTVIEGYVETAALPPFTFKATNGSCYKVLADAEPVEETATLTIDALEGNCLDCLDFFACCSYLVGETVYAPESITVTFAGITACCYGVAVSGDEAFYYGYKFTGGYNPNQSFEVPILTFPPNETGDCGFEYLLEDLGEINWSRYLVEELPGDQTTCDGTVDGTGTSYTYGTGIELQIVEQLDGSLDFFIVAGFSGDYPVSPLAATDPGEFFYAVARDWDCAIGAGAVIDNELICCPSLFPDTPGSDVGCSIGWGDGTATILINYAAVP